MSNILEITGSTKGFSQDLAACGVKTVLRYYPSAGNAQGTIVSLCEAELAELRGAGIAVIAVYVPPGGAPDPRRDAHMVKAHMARFGQPTGSAILFAPQARDARTVRAYFDALRIRIDAGYRLGVFATAEVLTSLSGLVDISVVTDQGDAQTRNRFIQEQTWALLRLGAQRRIGGGLWARSCIPNPAYSDLGHFFVKARWPAPVPLRVPRAVYAVATPALEGGLKQDQLVLGVGQDRNRILLDTNGDESADHSLPAPALKLLAGGFARPIGHTPYALACAELQRMTDAPDLHTFLPRLYLYNRTVTQGAQDHVPWASAFVNWCVTSAGLTGTNSRWAMSWHDQKWGRAVGGPPCRGDIAVYQCRFPTAHNKSAVGGHVGFVVRSSDVSIDLLAATQRQGLKIRTFPITSGTVGQKRFSLLSIRRG